MTSTSQTARRLFFAACGLLLAGSLAGAALTTRPDDWHPVGLVILLALLALFGEQLLVTIRAQPISATFVALILAMSLLGPAPAVVIGVAAMVYTSASRKLELRYWLANLAFYAAFPLAGALMVRAFVGDVHDPRNLHATQGIGFGFVVFVVFLATTAINFGLIATGGRVMWNRSLGDQVRELLIPILPAQLALGALTAIAAVAYTNVGLAVLPVVIILLGLFQYLVTRLVRSEDRLEQLVQQAMQGVSMEVGALSFGMHALEARHANSGRHAAAVARYAEELARESGCDDEEQRLAHSAGLLHDIGQGPLPDRVLHASSIADQQDWEAIRRHPIEGAAHVGHFPDYRKVADVILAHHERWDGSGYPDGLIGPEIPLLSRVVAICEAFDAMTAPGGYGERKSAEDAFAELRAAEGKQFDPDLVETFIAARTREGAPVIDDADLDVEIDVERRALMKAADPRHPTRRAPALQRLARLPKRVLRRSHEPTRQSAQSRPQETGAVVAHVNEASPTSPPPGSASDLLDRAF